MIKDYKKQTIAYYEQIDKDYLKKRGKLKPSTQLLEKFSKYLTGKKILEVGFGLGPDIPWFVENGYQYVGVEPSSNFCEVVRNKYPEITILNEDITKSDFEEESFDGIWAMASFLHLNDQHFKEVLDKCHKWLKPEGVLFISVKEGVGEKVDERGRYFNFFTKEKLETFIGDKFELLSYQVDAPQAYNRTPANWLNFYLRKK